MRLGFPILGRRDATAAAGSSPGHDGDAIGAVMLMMMVMRGEGKLLLFPVGYDCMEILEEGLAGVDERCVLPPGREADDLLKGDADDFGCGVHHAARRRCCRVVGHLL